MGVSQQCRPMSAEKHPNSPSHEIQEKEIKKTLIAGKQAFTWIHRNSLSQKIQENSCKHRKTRYFPKVHRTVNIGKQGKMPVFNCKPRVKVKFYIGKTSVNTGKQVIRQELTERSIPEKRRFPGFTVRGNTG